MGIGKNISRYLLTPGCRKFLRRIAVKMLSSGFIVFTLTFVTVASLGLVFQMTPWIFRTGVTDIEPLPLLLFSFIAAFAGLYIRYWLMKRFSHITVYPKKEHPVQQIQKPQEKKEKSEERNDEKPADNPS